MERPAAAVGTDAVEGTVQRVVYASEASGWTVLRLAVVGRGTVTAVGRLPAIQPGERLRLTGSWEEDRKYGRQFRAESYLSLKPSTMEGIERYLGSGMVPGIGKVMAGRLVAQFGLDTLEVIERQPDRLAEVEGIGPVRARSIRQAWQEQHGMREVMVFLQSHGVSTAHAVKIFKRYGTEAPELVRSDPYRLASDVFGIGFQTADRIAGRLGLPPDAPQRAAAGVLHVLDRATERGHVLLPRSELVREAAELLDLPAAAVETALAALVERGAVVREVPSEAGAGGAESFFRPDLHAAEVGIARRLAGLLAGREPLPAPPAEAIEGFERSRGLRLAAAPRRAVLRAAAERVLVITGGPGTGKTTLVRAVVYLLTRARRRVALAAPTGRAANRLAEATGAEAKTLHRLLEFDPRTMSFQRHRQRPLEADLVIVDEASMLDCRLAWQLVDALPEDGQLLLVGDVDQLPSVGPGRVLGDLIDSGVVPVVRLTRIFRQAASSLIVRNAHRILRGELPALAQSDPDADFHFIARREPEQILDTLERLLTERIPRRFGLDPRRDIQVLTPMRRGLLGTENLNRELQRLLNPAGRRLEPGGGRLLAGDRVMQLRNNYDLEVFNGEVGWVEGTDAGGDKLRV